MVAVRARVIPAEQLDTYSAGVVVQQQKTYLTTAGVHTVTVVVSGNKNPAASAVYVIVDVFTVAP